jgi:hypothetical protein
MEVKFMEIIITFVAIYGAILSTLLTIKEIISERKRIKLKCGVSVLQTNNGGIGRYFSITAINVGHRPVQIIMAGFLLIDGDKFAEFTQTRNSQGLIPLPKIINDSESVTILLNENIIRETILEMNDKKMRYSYAFVKDAEGNIIKKPLPNWFNELKREK